LRKLFLGLCFWLSTLWQPLRADFVLRYQDHAGDASAAIRRQDLWLARRQAVEALHVVQRHQGGNRPAAGYRLEDLGLVDWWLARMQEADKSLRQALGIFQGARLEADVCRIHLRLAELDEAWGRPGDSRLELGLALPGLVDRGLWKEASILQGRLDDFFGEADLPALEARRARAAASLSQTVALLTRQAQGAEGNASCDPQVFLDLMEAESSLGNDGLAAKAFRSASSMARRVYGPAHPLNARVAFLRAGTLSDHKEARRRYREAESLWRGAYGPGHPALALCEEALGKVDQSDGRVKEAAAHFKEAAKILQGHLGRYHPRVRELEARIAP
jgi:tetratricopeptide (TPR) repeat protein